MKFDDDDDSSRAYAARAIHRAVRQRCRLTSAPSALRKLDQPIQPHSASGGREQQLVDLIDVDRCVATLTAEQQHLLSLRCAWGYTYAEIATRTRLSPRTAERRVSVALLLLAVVMRSRHLI